MKVVVELNKEEMESYKNLLRLGFGNTAMRKITNGTPLPEGAEILTAEAYSDLCLRASKECKTDTCTNDGEDYAECDQFVCSKCGIELQDWHSVERDMDDGEVSYHEYTFRFCPHCGRRIVEGSDSDAVD